MDETVAAAIRLLRTELDALHIVQNHAEMPQPPQEAVTLIQTALDELARAQRLLDPRP